MSKKPKSRKSKVKKSQSRTVAIPTTFGQLLPYIGIISLIGFVALFPTIHADFTELDDKRLILEKVPMYVESSWAFWHAAEFTPHYKPLVLASWVLESRIYGFNPVGFHIVNLLFHIFNSILIFLITLRLASRFKITRGNIPLVALATGVFFAIHPLHVESVAWAMGRKDLFYTFFVLLASLTYLRFINERSWKWMGLIMVFFTLAMASKAPAVMFFGIVFLLDFAYDRPLNRQTISEKWPIAFLLVVGLYFYGIFGHGPGTSPGAHEGQITQVVSASPITNLEPLASLPAIYAKVALIGFRGVFWYAHSWLPVGLALAYPYKAWLPAIGHAIHIFPIILLAFGAFVWWKRKRYRLLFFTHAIFFTATVPAILRTGLGTGIFLSDRYVYLGLWGLLFFASGGLVWWMLEKKWPESRQRIALGLLAAIMSAMSFTQAKVWDNGETLWTNNIEKYPSVAYAYSNRGIYYQETGQPAKAAADFSKAADIEDDVHALINRAILLRQQGKYQEALADLDRILSRDPNNGYALGGKGNVLFTMGRYADAVQVYTKGIQADPRDLSLRINRSAAYYYLGQVDNALADLDNVELKNKNYSGLYSKKTVIYKAQQNWPKVVEYAQLTTVAEPQNDANFGDLGLALQRLGRYQEAVDAYTRAINILPTGKRYFLGRAQSYRALGNQNAAQNDENRAAGL